MRTIPLILAAVLVTAAVGGWFLLRDNADEAVAVPIIDQQLASVAVDKPIQGNSIAVLPFVNLSNDPEQAYFSDGLAEDILNGLARVSQVRVMARATSFQFKGDNIDPMEIGRRLGVTHVLEGSVRKSGDRIRVNVQMASTSDGAQLWSNRFEREFVDIFKVQDEITSGVLNILLDHFEPRSVIVDKTSSTDAYNALLTSRYYFERLQFQQAVDEAELAIALDPEYGTAYSQLAQIKSFFVWWSIVPPQVLIPEISAHLDHALALNPELLEAKTQKLLLDFFVQRDYQAGINAVNQLLAENPNNTAVMATYMVMLQTLGHVNEAANITRYGLSFDSLSPAGHRQLAEQLLYAGRFVEARQSATQAEKLGLNVALMLSRIAVVQGDIQTLEQQLARPAEHWVNGKDSMPTFEAELLLLQGRRNEAIQVLQATIAESEVPLPATNAHLSFLLGDPAPYLALAAESMRNNHFYAIRNAVSGERRFIQPEFYSSTGYLDLLREFGLDPDSLARIEVPTLPAEITR